MSTVSAGSSVSNLRFDVLDSVYRQLYTTLAITLMLDPKLSLDIMSFWIWMEKNGFIDTVVKIQNLPLDLISGLADEAVLCINFFKNVIFPTPLELSNTMPLLHFLIKKELLLLMFLPRNRVSAIRGIKKVLNDLLHDFADIYREAKWSHEMSQLIRSFNGNVSFDNGGGSSSRLSNDDSSLRLYGGTSRIRYESSSSTSWSLSTSHDLNSLPQNGAARTIGHDPVKVVLTGSPVSSPHGYVGLGRTSRSNRGATSQSQNHILLFSTKRCGESPVQVVPATVHNKSFHYDQPTLHPQQLMKRDTRYSAVVVPPAEDRTLFVTFSKGYRVHEAELMKYMSNWLGEYCIEEIIMQEASRDEQPLYARIVFHCPETIDVILKGNERYKFSINGKHVWVRKYIPKNQRARNNSNYLKSLNSTITISE